jgi:hypothetical protein
MDDLNRQDHIHLPGDTPDEEHDEFDEEFTEAYCVVCRHMVVMSGAEAVWTSRGTPGTRGVCPDCGTTVFRMGKTPAHDKLVRPAAIRVEGGVKIATGSGRKRAQPATYINYASVDSEFAQKLASDLEKAGIHTWIDAHQNTPGDVKWAGGVHPALKDSVKMVVVLSATAKDAGAVTKAWTFFRGQKKPVMVALVEPVEAPDPLRRCPRFDFSQDYISAFRQLLSALGD